MASHYDISGSAAITALLTEQLPYLSSLNLTIRPSTITMPNGSVEVRAKVQGNFNDPNFRAYKTLPQNVRQIFRPARGKAPTAKQVEVYTFVQQLEGPPGRKGEDKLWWENTAAPAWNKAHPHRPLQWESLRKEYQDTAHALRQRENSLMP
jgi:hypothetical protein